MMMEPLGSAGAARDLLNSLFLAGVNAASPRLVVPEALVEDDLQPSILLAAGKAAVEMAEAALFAGAWPKTGLVVTRRGQGRPVANLNVVEAGHPTPDYASAQAAQRMLALASQAQEGERVLVLLSGGASSLLCAPADGFTLDAKRALTVSLLRSGAAIDEINIVRRHLSRIKGGRLAAAAFPASVTTLAISDVVGDAPEAIASGPTVCDPATLADAHAILRRYEVAPPLLGWSESCKSSDPRLGRSRFRIIASAAQSLAAVRTAARARGFQPVDLGGDLQGEARDLGRRHAETARQYLRSPGRYALISGGELTVAVTGGGRGGPNFEYAAALAVALEGAIGVAALSGDTDGLDGDSGAAGAFVFGDSAARMRQAGVSLEDALANNDTARAFESVGDVFARGRPARTSMIYASCLSRLDAKISEGEIVWLRQTIDARRDPRRAFRSAAADEE